MPHEGTEAGAECNGLSQSSLKLGQWGHRDTVLSTFAFIFDNFCNKSRYTSDLSDVGVRQTDKKTNMLILGTCVGVIAILDGRPSLRKPRERGWGPRAVRPRSHPKARGLRLGPDGRRDLGLQVGGMQSPWVAGAGVTPRGV